MIAGCCPQAKGNLRQASETEDFLNGTARATTQGRLPGRPVRQVAPELHWAVRGVEEVKPRELLTTAAEWGEDQGRAR